VHEIQRDRFGGGNDGKRGDEIVRMMDNVLHFFVNKDEDDGKRMRMKFYF
jgi:hypothetical protein